MAPVAVPKTQELQRPDAGRLAGSTFLSLVIHTAVIAGAIHVTVSVRRAAPPPAALGTAVVVIAPPEPQYETPPPPAVDLPLNGFQIVTAPAAMLTAIPSVSLQEHFAPKDFTAVGVEGGTTDVVPPGDAVCDASVLDEPPILLLSPPLDYPPLLQQAGLAGRVVVQAVIDTTGRAEPASVSVIPGAHPAFDQSSRQWMLHAQFRPARVGGRPVRVWVNRALDYAITGLSSPARTASPVQKTARIPGCRS